VGLGVTETFCSKTTSLFVMVVYILKHLSQFSRRTGQFMHLKSSSYIKRGRGGNARNYTRFILMELNAI